MKWAVKPGRAYEQESKATLETKLQIESIWKDNPEDEENIPKALNITQKPK